MVRSFSILCAAFFLLSSCNRTYEKALKSNDPEAILEAADKLYEEEKWEYAIELYKKIARTYAGKKEANKIAYRAAYANFYDKNYPLAASRFKNYYIAYNPSDSATEALYMAAYCYYKGSPEYNLDQTNTLRAISALQNFIDTYPESKHVASANGMIEELQKKLAKKAFEIAESYYKTLKYKSSAVAFANFLDDFPDSDYREEAFINLVRSKVKLAMNSTFNKKSNRLKEAKTSFLLFSKKYPSSEFIEEAIELNEDVEKETKRHNSILSSLKK